MVIPRRHGDAQRPILIVDDDRDTRTMVATMLTVHGYTVQMAQDGAEGLELLRQHQPQLVLLDLQMPRMSGVAFRAVQQKLPQELADIPVVIVSGLEDTAERRRQLQVAEYVQKPIDDTTLLRIVRAYCKTPD